MSTVTLPRGTVGAGGASQAALYGRPQKTLVAIVDLVDAAATKGSALAQDDVIQSIAVPANTRINSVYVRCIEAADVGTLNVDVGLGTDVDLYVDGQSMTTTGLLQPTAHAVGNFIPSTISSPTSTFAFTSTYDTIDVTLMTFTGTVPTAGQLAIYADVVDLTTPQGANIAAV